MVRTSTVWAEKGSNSNPAVSSQSAHDKSVSALDGGADGLDFYRRIAAECRNYLNDGGMLILEAGAGEADAVDALFGAKSERIKDYNIPPVDRVLIYGNICAADPGSSGGSRNTFKE